MGKEGRPTSAPAARKEGGGEGKEDGAYWRANAWTVGADAKCRVGTDTNVGRPQGRREAGDSDDR